MWGTAALMLFCFSLVVGCQSIAKDPFHPTPKSLVAKYKNALETKSCFDFQELQHEPLFPLKDLARLRAQQACDQGPIRVDEYPDWMADAALDAAIEWAQKHDDRKDLMELYLDKSKQNLPEFQKLDWTEKALKIARSLTDDKAIHTLKQRREMIAPRFIAHPKPEDDLAVADDYRLAREFPQAIRYYKKITRGRHFSIGEKIAAYKGIRTSYKNDRQADANIRANAQLIRYLHRLSRRPNHFVRKQLLDARLYQARALWTQGKTRPARRQLSLALRHLKKENLSEVYWLLGRMKEEKGRNQDAAALMQKALAQKPTDQEFKDKILWSLAWSTRQTGKMEQAAGFFKNLADQTQNDFTRSRARFWLAKTWLDLQKNDQADTLLTQLTKDDPLGYYGLLAHYELKLPIAQVPVRASTSIPWSLVKELRTYVHPEIPEWLSQIGEKDLLEPYLDEVSADYRKVKDQDDEVWLHIFRYYANGGLFLKLYEKLGQLSPERSALILDHHPDLLFPEPWPETVQKAAKSASIHPELIYAIMRQESAFNPQARSPADAFGLMQLLPEIARQLCSTTDMKMESPQDLYDPQMNIRLGAQLLRKQLDLYNGKFILAVASYNANERAIRNWMKTRYHGNTLEFIEDIPYEETRSYVRLVMRNLIYYQLLNSPQTKIEFPSWVLDL